MFTYAQGSGSIRSGKQLHRETPCLHTSGRIDARADFEDYVIYGDMTRLQPGKRHHRKQTLARVFVQALETEMCEYAVFSYHGDQVRSYAHHQQIQQWKQALEFNRVALTVGLGKFEAHSAA